jgi:TPP-dependent pyruvate/acetoin dehydrogenase alpha subunit
MVEEITLELYKRMLRIRVFEESVLDLFSEGVLSGTTHAYIGQEANAVGLISALNHDDFVISNHRCHGHYIAFKNNPYALLCEMMGKADGLCAGKGGSQHICDDNFFSNGVQGGIVPLGAGIAFAEKIKGSGKIVVVFIGDGTLGEGVVYETLNLISKWELPILIVVENNQYAQSTKIENSLAGTVAGRFEAFGIKTSELSTFDCLEINSSAEKIVDSVRQTSRPQVLILNTYRFASHSKSDDGRDPEEIKQWLDRDPLLVFESRMDSGTVESLRRKAIEENKIVVEKALSAEPAVLQAGKDYFE